MCDDKMEHALLRLFIMLYELILGPVASLNYLRLTFGVPILYLLYKLIIINEINAAKVLLFKCFLRLIAFF